LKKKHDAAPAKLVHAPLPEMAGGAVTGDSFFADMQDDFERLAASPDLLTSIPCWGWPGDGKTCSLLTAIHFCDVARHGVSLARVKDSAELERLEEQQPIYRGLGLASIAEATVARLNQLNDVFLVDNEWPPGTETANLYLLEVRAKKGRVAFALLPDLRGGSFQQPDAASRTVIAGAHAFVVMVNPKSFIENTPSGKEYRDDVIGRLQRCAEDGIPTCVMIAKTDRNLPATDQTHKALAALLESLKFQSRIFRVSVVGDTPIEEGLPPPALAERNPEQLIHAWAWVLHAALTRSRDELVKKIPATNLAEAARLRAPKAVPIRELRLVRDEQKALGQVLCAVPSAINPSFLILEATGGLKELVINAKGAPSFKVHGKLGESIDPDFVKAVVRDGNVFLEGADTEMWVGPLSSPIKTQLPYALEVWEPISEQLLAGLDAKGTLHILRLGGDKWEAVDYLSSFTTPSPNMVLGYLPNERAVITSGGETTAAVNIQPNGKFSERLNIAVSVPYTQGPAAINHQAFIVGRGAANEVIFGREKAFNIGTTLPENALMALASDAPIVAWVGPENALHAAAFSDGGPVTTDPKMATKLSEVPQRMAWDAMGRSLLLTYPSGRWACFNRYGF